MSAPQRLSPRQATSSTSAGPAPCSAGSSPSGRSSLSSSEPLSPPLALPSSSSQSPPRFSFIAPSSVSASTRQTPPSRPSPSFSPRCSSLCPSASCPISPDSSQSFSASIFAFEPSSPHSPPTPPPGFSPQPSPTQ